MSLESVPSEPVELEDLENLVGELRAMARQLLASESQPYSISPTALAMTALRRVKLKDQDWNDLRWENRAHFFSAVARAMRNALIDHARRRKARGRNEIVYFSPDEVVFANLSTEAEERPDRIIVLEEALAVIERSDKHLADILDQYYYACYSIAEMAQFGGVSEKTIDRDLKRARTLLKKTVEKLLAV
jgi:RNA polymerase sigma factor (TIGR02999 family)